MPEFSTLTKFPFWSAIIIRTGATKSVAGSSSVTIAIQPASGETWFIFVSLAGEVYIAHRTYMYDGSTATVATAAANSSGAPTSVSHAVFIITNTAYMQIQFGNSDTTNARNGYYTYSGFKLSKPLYTPKRLNDPSKPWKRTPTQFPIPSQVQALSKYIVDLIDPTINDYRQAIICEENTPLAIDEKGNVIERMTVHIWVDDFINNILTPYKNGKLDLVKAGWKKYFDKWASEGITL